MSQQALKELQEARERILRQQRVCAWCGSAFESADELADHIMEEQLRLWPENRELWDGPIQ